MPDDDDDKQRSILPDFRKLGLNSKADYATALLGAALGGSVDVFFLGKSAGWFAFAGASTGLGAKRSAEALFEKRKLTKKCRSLMIYYADRSPSKSDRCKELLDKITEVPELTAGEIRNALQTIETEE